MRDFSISVDIAATPARVWDVMSDGERWAEWTPSVTSVVLHDKVLRIGGRATIVQPKLAPAKFKVLAFEMGKSFTWGTGIPGIVYVVAHHSIQPTAAGARVTLALHFGGLLGGIAGKHYAALNDEYLAMEAAGLKRFSEEGARDPNTSLADWNAEAVRRMGERSPADPALGPRP